VRRRARSAGAAHRAELEFGAPDPGQARSSAAPGRAREVAADCGLRGLHRAAPARRSATTPSLRARAGLPRRDKGARLATGPPSPGEPARPERQATVWLHRYKAESPSRARIRRRPRAPAAPRRPTRLRWRATSRAPRAGATHRDFVAPSRAARLAPPVGLSATARARAATGER